MSARGVEGGAGFDGIEQIAFEIKDLALLDQRAVEIGIGEFGRRAEVGVHRALAVRRHQDKAAAGWRFAPGLAIAENDADGADVVREHPGKLVVAHLAHEANLAAQRGDTGASVGRRAARGLDRRPHPLVKRRGFLGRGQAHGALVERELIQQRLLAGGDDVDERVADAGYLQGLIHEDRAFVAAARGAGVLGSNLQRLAMTQRQHSGFFALQT